MIDTMSDEPLGLTEIGELLGVSRQRAFTLSKRADFPTPTATLKAGRIWDRTEVEAWEATWDRSNQGGRPKQKKAVEHSPPEPKAEASTPVIQPEPPASEPAADNLTAWMLTNPLPDGTSMPPRQLGLSRPVAALPVRRARLLATAVEKQHPEWAQQARAELSHIDPRWFHHALLQAAVNAGKAEIPA